MRIWSRCHLHFLPHRRMHTPPHQEVSYQFQEALRSWIETGNNAETTGNRRDVHFLTVSLAGWPVCQAILAEFQQEYLTCPTNPADWKKVEGNSEPDGVPLCCRGSRLETYHHEEAQESWE